MRTLVIFGASGDLAKRYLFPALGELEAHACLPRELAIVGSARRDWTEQHFRQIVQQALDQHASSVAPDARRRLIERISYASADMTDAKSVRTILAAGHGPMLLYLAVPPSLAPGAIEALAASQPPAGSRVVIEKPFGEDLASARALNQLLRRHFDDDDVLRIDHFLGLRTVRNLLALRFANRAFEPLFCAAHVERVDIVWDETLALEGRAGYFDRAGAVRDVIQNHLLQVLALFAMEPPTSLRPRDLGARKRELLAAVRRPTLDQAAAAAVRGRYGAGAIGKKQLPAYVDEDGVDAGRETETFAQLEVRIDNERWQDVPFFLRTGKALARDRREVMVTLRRAACSPLFDGTDNNRLQIGLEPDGLALTVDVIADDDRRPYCATTLETRLPAEPLSAYARVLEAALAGNSTTAVGAKEAELSWQVVEPFLQAFRTGRPPLLEYPAGSDGPVGATLDASVNRDSR